MPAHNRLLTPILTGACLVLGLTLVANSGPLNPPAGTVSPSGRTLDEIYNAAIAAGMSGGDQPMPVSDVRELIAMKISGSPSGDIEGEDDVFGMRDSIRVFGIDHEVFMPVSSGGLPTGARQHRPLTVRKQIDKATPLLYDTLARNGVIDKVELYHYKFRPGTQNPIAYYKITLQNARIISVRADTEDVASNMFTHDEFVSFVYQTITWEHLEGGTSAQDDFGGTNPG